LTDAAAPFAPRASPVYHSCVPANSRATIRLVLGVIMFALGLFVAVRPLFTHNSVLTGARWLDLTFAFVFMVRGAMNVRSARRLSR
jgi:uncharacterized membrane protein HdeD (DUF308 family)